MRSAFALLVCLIGLGAAKPVVAADHLPFVNGRVQEYRWHHYLPSEDENGYYHVRWEGPTVVNGDTVFLRQFLDGPYRNRTEYWSENGDHDKFLHGYDITGYGGHSSWFSSPIPEIVEPLYVGATWTFTSGSTYFWFEVTAETETVTGLGTFPAFSIWGGGIDFGKDGDELDMRYADGLGLVYFYDQHAGRYEWLNSIDDTTPVEPLTWGRLKGFYR